MQAGQRRVEEATGLFGLADVAIEEQLGDDRRQPQRGRQRLDSGRVVRQQVPGFCSGAHQVCLSWWPIISEQPHLAAPLAGAPVCDLQRRQAREPGRMGIMVLQVFWERCSRNIGPAAELWTIAQRTKASRAGARDAWPWRVE